MTARSAKNQNPEASKQTLQVHLTQRELQKTGCIRITTKIVQLRSTPYTSYCQFRQFGSMHSIGVVVSRFHAGIFEVFMGRPQSLDSRFDCCVPMFFFWVSLEEKELVQNGHVHAGHVHAKQERNVQYCCIVDCFQSIEDNIYCNTTRTVQETQTQRGIATSA